MRKADSFPVGLVLLILLVGVGSSFADNEVGAPVEDFTLPDLDGNPRTLSEETGQIIVLNFFTTWCPGCNEEAEALENDLWLAYRERGVTVIAIDVMEQLPLVQGWRAARGVTYDIWMAPDWELFRLFPQAVSLPYNTVIDRRQTLRYAQIGFDQLAVTAMVETILAEDSLPSASATWAEVKALFR